ncbi:glutathione S-transferase kappa 1 [Arapaima gigas]
MRKRKLRGRGQDSYSPILAIALCSRGIYTTLAHGCWYGWQREAVVVHCDSAERHGFPQCFGVEPRWRLLRSHSIVTRASSRKRRHTGRAATTQRTNIVVCWFAATLFQMAAPRKVIELFYDVVSPYSWLGFEVLCRYRHVWNIDLKLRPALLGGIMQGAGNKPPAFVPNKFAYMAKDLSRLRNYFAVPLVFPTDPFEVMFQKGSLAAMRFVTAVAEKEGYSEADVEKVSRELWLRIWSRDEDVTLPTSLSEAGVKAGLSAGEVEELLRLTTSQKIKDKLKSTTQEALDLGAFGFPLSVCHIDGQKELFFGSDRFEVMAHCLGEKWFGPQPTHPTARL